MVSWLALLAGGVWPLLGAVLPVPLVRWSCIPLFLEALSIASRQTRFAFPLRLLAWLPLSLGAALLPPAVDTLLAIFATVTGAVYFLLAAFFVVFAAVRINHKLITEYEDTRPNFVRGSLLIQMVVGFGLAIVVFVSIYRDPFTSTFTPMLYLSTGFLMCEVLVMALLAGFDEHANLSDVALIALYALTQTRLAFKAQHYSSTLGSIMFLYNAVMSGNVFDVLGSIISPLVLLDLFVTRAVPLLTSLYLLPLIQGDIIQSFGNHKSRGDDDEPKPTSIVSSLAMLMSFHYFLEMNSYWNTSALVSWHLLQGLSAPLMYVAILLVAARERQSEFRNRY